MSEQQTNPATRIASIDIFRGLTMMVMVFVNDVGEVKGVPWWSKHAPTHLDYMTYVDMVFPAFLFIVGMSLPLAMNRRIEKGDSEWRLWWHMFVRSAGLMILGIFLANLHLIDPPLAGVDVTLWSLTGLLGIFLAWNVYPKQEGREWLPRVLKGAGLLMLAGAFAVFRRKTPEGAAWLDFSYWEILGLIGFAYLSACIIYLPLRKRPWAVVAAFVALSAMNVLARTPVLSWINRWPGYVWPFGDGSLVSIVMGGVVTSLIFFHPAAPKRFRGRAWCALSFAAILLVSGLALVSFGISKNRATPAWCLWCCCANVLLFLALYWIADVKQRRGWAWFVKSAGGNTLTTYLLPYVLLAIPACVAAEEYFDAGWPGVARSVAFTALVLALAGLLTRWKVRLAL